VGSNRVYEINRISATKASLALESEFTMLEFYQA